MEPDADSFSRTLARLYHSHHATDNAVEGPYRQAVAELFRYLREPAVLIGGLGYNHYVDRPRGTADIDIAVATTTAYVEIAEQIRPAFKLTGPTTFVHSVTGLPVDFIDPRLGGRMAGFAVRDPNTILLDDVTVPIAKPEWIIGLKLRRAIGRSAEARQDQADIIKLMEATRPELKVIVPLLTHEQFDLLRELESEAE